MRVGQARRRDTTERAIVEALRACGVFVVALSGKDAPDLLCRFQGIWTPLEAKSGKGRLRPGQAAAGYPMVRSIDDALQLIVQGPTRQKVR